MRDLRSGLAGGAFLLLAAVLSPAVHAAAVTSTSGNLSMEIVDFLWTPPTQTPNAPLPTAPEVVAIGGDLFRLQATGGGDLVPAGWNLNLEIEVARLLGPDITSWFSQIVGGAGTGMGEDVKNPTQSQVLGTMLLNNTLGTSATVTFAAQNIGLFILKDINADGATLTAQGSVSYVLQGPQGPVGVPEPASLALLATGMAGLVALRRRRRPALA